MKMSYLYRSALALALALVPAGAFAQVPSNVGPYNVDLGALITNTAVAPSTVTSSQQTNVNQKGVVCTYKRTAASGTPSVTFKIQGYDTATNTYLDYITSGAITDTTTTAIGVYPGMSATPATGYTAISAHLPAKWRVSMTFSTSSTTDTSKIGCVLLN